MPITITIEEAQANLKELIHQLAPGEEVIITENRLPVARLVNEQPASAKPPRPGPGLCKGMITYMAPDFDAPLEDMKEYGEEDAMQAIALSEAAIALLRRRLVGERIEVTDETRPLYWELVDAGLMIPLHTFALRPNSAFRLSDAACDLRDAGWNGLTDPANHAPSA